MRDTTTPGIGVNVVFSEGQTREQFARTIFDMVESKAPIEFVNVEWEDPTEDRVAGIRFDIISKDGEKKLSPCPYGECDPSPCVHHAASA